MIFMIFTGGRGVESTLTRNRIVPGRQQIVVPNVLYTSRDNVPRSEGRRKVCRAASTEGSSEDDNSLNLASMSFILLRVLNGSLGLAMLFFPQQVLEKVCAVSANTLVSGLLMMIGGVHLYAALIADTLVSASDHGRLGSDTYKRLGTSLAVFGYSGLAKVLCCSCQMNLLSLGIYGGSLVLTGVIPMIFSKGYILGLKKWKPFPLISLENLYGLSYLGVIAAVLAVWYSKLLPFSFLGEQLGSLNWILTPAGTLGHDMLEFLSVTGGALLVGAFVTLLDAHQRGRLGASTFKQLNLGMGALSAIWAWVFYKLQSEGSLTVPNLFAPYVAHLMDIFTMKLSIFFPIVGVFCLWQWYFAKK